MEKPTFYIWKREVIAIEGDIIKFADGKIKIKQEDQGAYITQEPIDLTQLEERVVNYLAAKMLDFVENHSASLKDWGKTFEKVFVGIREAAHREVIKKLWISDRPQFPDLLLQITNSDIEDWRAEG